MTDVIVDHVYRFNLIQEIAGATMYNGLDLLCQGTFGSVDMAAVAEAYWNHVKTYWRGLYPSDFGNVFSTLTWQDMTDQEGAFGEFAIPTAERVGTRVVSPTSTYAAGFIACGVRLTVGARNTRPGQKRLYGITEADLNGNTFTSAYLTVAEALADRLSGVATLGIPAAGVELQPVVLGLDETGAIERQQPIVGYVVNQVVTSQRSRRLGHGI